MTIDELQKAVDALLDPLDYPRTWTQRQCDAYETTRQTLKAKMLYARQQTAVLAKVVPTIAVLEQALQDVTEMRAILYERLERQPPGHHPTDAAKCDTLRACIACCDQGLAVLGDGYHLTQSPLGHLMLARGHRPSTPAPFQVCGALTFPGSIPVLQAKLKALYAEKLDAEARLADALCDVPEPVLA